MLIFHHLTYTSVFRFTKKSIHPPHFLCNILYKQGKSLRRHSPDHINLRQCPLILNYSTPATNAKATLQTLPDPNDLFSITNNVQYYLTIIKTTSQDSSDIWPLLCTLYQPAISMDMGN